MMPYSSTRKPISGHLNRISASPAKKAAVPLSFCLRAKKTSVFCGPMMMVRPMRKRICRGEGGLVRFGWGGGGGAGYVSHGEHGAVEEEHDAAYEEEAACWGGGQPGGSVAGRDRGGGDAPGWGFGGRSHGCGQRSEVGWA